MTTSAYASFDTSYVNRVPYITTAEYNNAPTAMDTSNLLPSSAGSVAQQVALQETIGRASSWIDQFTMGLTGTLAATLNTENARVWGNNRGQLIIHPLYWPILEVDSFVYSAQGFGANNGASITPAGSIWIEPQEFVVQPQGIVGLGLGAAGGILPGIQYFCIWSYTNGYPVSTLSASVAPGGTSINPASVVGIYPNTTLTLYDLPYDEQVQVASTYVPGAAVVPLATSLMFNHAAGVMVTNLPPAIKQAAISATTALIKQRGSGALIVADMGAVTHQQSGGGAQNSGGDWELAKMLLQPFKQIFVGY